MKTKYKVYKSNQHNLYDVYKMVDKAWKYVDLVEGLSENDVLQKIANKDHQIDYR